MSTTTEVRPFHETIVKAIRRCDRSPSHGEILRLFEMIKETKIPKGHDEIIAVINEFFGFPGADKWAKDVRLVKESVLAQKQAVTQKPSSPRGTWFLVYSWLNSFKNGAIEDKEIALVATTETEAITEGSARWKEVSDAEWKRHEGLNMRPEGHLVFDGVESNPQIIYKISL